LIELSRFAPEGWVPGAIVQADSPPVPLDRGGIIAIAASAISLNVDDPVASADFVKQHFGFREDMAADGFVSLSRADAGFNLIYLRTGLETFKPDSMRGRRADGLLVVFVVDDIDGEYARLQGEGVTITTPIQTEDWGERFFQVTDPNGIVIQLVQWMTEED
jgi:catechol 2,3-dioxygenase-like lactoylglutathione lyase family enzyme